MTEGFWTVRFKYNQQAVGAGVVLLQAGKLYGGDTGFSYVGTYDEAADGAMHARLRVERHSNLTESVMPEIGDYDLELSGQSGQQQFTLSGSPAQYPSLQLQVQLTRKADVD